MHFFYSVPMIIIYVILLSGIYVHYRGKFRLPLSRQLTDHSTFFGPINIFMYLFSKVPNKPFLETKDFPELKILEDNWETIRDEGLELLTNGAVKASDKKNDAGFNSFFKTGWKRFYLKWYGYNHASAIEHCPQTVKWLNNIPSIKAAVFTYLPPGARLVRHRDPYAGSLRYHLGLKTPNSEDCHIVVDTETRFWQDGQGMLFDETYLHYAENKTDKGRLILFCDIERPLKFIIPAWVNKFFGFILLKSATSPNETGDKTGFVNKIFGGVYKIREFGKSIKAKNKPLYYFLKYLLILLIIYLLLFSWYF